MLKLTRLVTALLLTLPAIQAHDFYILPDLFHVQAGASVRVAFDNGDSFPDSEVAPSLERLKDAVLGTATWSSAVSDLHERGKEIVGTAKAMGSGCAFLSARTAPNSIELRPDEFLAYLKEEGLTEVIRWRDEHQQASKPGRERYTKFAKSLLVSGTPDGFYKEPLRLPIEIVPLQNPYALNAGALLPVRVLFRGKPAPDLQLEAAWAGEGGKSVQVIGRTDSDGRIDVRLTKAGRWRLHSLAMERCADPSAADWESFWASLTFEIR